MKKKSLNLKEKFVNKNYVYKIKQMFKKKIIN